MSSIMTTAIATLCLSTPGVYNNACQHALNAGSQQSGYAAKVDQVEDGTVQYTKSHVEKMLGDEKWFLGATLFAAKVVKEKKVDFTVPNMGLCDKISSEVAPKSYGMTLKWSF